MRKRIFWRTGRDFSFWTTCGLLSAAVLSPAFGQSKSSGMLHDRGGYDSQRFGLCEDYAEADRTQAKLDRDFRCLREVGAGILRVGISWQNVEPEPGRYDWTFWDRLVETAEKNHVRLIPYVCYTPKWAASRPEHFWKQPPARLSDFQHFMGVIAGRYRGRVHSWELWNEPDNQDFWLGDVAQYAALAMAGAAGVRQADPQAVIVLGGIADGWGKFLEALVGRYRMGTVVQVLNVHGYFETWNPRPLEDYPNYIAHAAALAQAGPHPMTLWMAEFGYSSASLVEGREPSHTPESQASALFKSHVLALSTGQLSLTAWYRIDDLRPGTPVIGDSLNWSLGILDSQGQPKPAFFALRFYERLFGQPTPCRHLTVRITPVAGGASAARPVVHVFEKADGTILVIGWLGPSHSGAEAPAEEVSVTLPPMPPPQIAVFDVTGHRLPSSAGWSGGTLRHAILTQKGLFIARLTPRRSHGQRAK